MADAAEAICRFVEGRRLEDFATDDVLRSAVYWKFVVIGEALSQLKKLDPGLYNQISESSRIVGFRNQVIHGYA